jgi:hypothetical protein
MMKQQTLLVLLSLPFVSSIKTPKVQLTKRYDKSLCKKDEAQNILLCPKKNGCPYKTKTILGTTIITNLFVGALFVLENYFALLREVYFYVSLLMFEILILYVASSYIYPRKSLDLAFQIFSTVRQRSVFVPRVYAFLLKTIISIPGFVCWTISIHCKASLEKLSWSIKFYDGLNLSQLLTIARNRVFKQNFPTARTSTIRSYYLESTIFGPLWEEVILRSIVVELLVAVVRYSRAARHVMQRKQTLKRQQKNLRFSWSALTSSFLIAILHFCKWYGSEDVPNYPTMLGVETMPNSRRAFFGLCSACTVFFMGILVYNPLFQTVGLAASIGANMTWNILSEILGFIVFYLIRVVWPQLQAQHLVDISIQP